MKESYALANPISVLLDKPREEFTRRDLLRVIEERQMERITLHYTALDGKLKELKIPLANRSQADHILADGERADGSSLFKGMVDASVSDLYVVPLYKTAFLNPFDPNSLDFICRYLDSSGTYAAFAPDNILLNAHAYFKKSTGFTLNALGELEFYLLAEPESHIFLAGKQRGYHASAPFIKTGKVLDEMVRYITQITGAVKYAHSEVGYLENVHSDLAEINGKRAEQLEIEMLPTPIDEAGDILVLAKWLIRNVAYRNNCVATFTPKLEEGVAGSGMHVHVELCKDERNVMLGTDGRLTTEARRLIGGFCTYADSLTAFGNTISPAYLRLVPNQEAPTRICWSDCNRSAMIRVPLGWVNANDLGNKLNPQQDVEKESSAGRQTVELRSPDGSAAVHLLLAGMTLAAEWGLTHPGSLELAEQLYVRGNIFEDPQLLQRLQALPKSCVESGKLLLEKRSLYEREGIFPASIIDYSARLLFAEQDEDLNNHLLHLPADDRLKETRKLMHKDLHRH
ncbi:MAG: Glutamine synthetase 1 [bacterium ADurb.Bin431]|nr:MAG: Glutamine synthetase 1 [bacterium ADurb.Bin431]HNY89958.1 glutamine synthetase family protein [bacterium]HOC24030.1 glutamine synthetase family protein [bacterium]HOH07031.1 glutamine synthetase family protein [bacterium]HOY43631.1 glutamine synthetase family protein [bacterium]